MRVLVATDGSPCGNVAVNLVASMAWPKETIMNVVTALEPVHVDASAAWVGVLATDPTEADAAATTEAQHIVDRALSVLRSTGVDIRTTILRERAASGITDEAHRWTADLVVVGSRGHGRIASMLLGSVSSEVVDHAPCPVLVARGNTAGHVMLATDGSAPALRAEEMVTMLPIAPESVIDVLNVTRQDGHEHQSAADDAVVRLRAKGLHADALVAAGDASEGILTLARGRSVDLIVMGTRGLTGIDRLRLGSVARNVLHHAHCSVLITHAVS